MKNLCPHHKKRLNISKQWRPPDGLDERMRRFSCVECSDYWYKAPKHCLMRSDEVQITFGIEVK